MSVLKQNLPLQVMPVHDNPEGLKYQGLLDELETEFIRIKIDPDFFAHNYSGEVLVEFTMSAFNFHFDTAIGPGYADGSLRIQKPKKIFKSQIRKSPRISTNVLISYNIWTELGRYEAVMTDLSTKGLKMRGNRRLDKNTLISVNVFIPGKNLRFICQGLVMWNRQQIDSPGVYDSGVLFTTLSLDGVKRVEKFILENKGSMLES